MTFVKYMHIEKLISPEVQDILLGDVYVFPKIDGTNASVWFDGEKVRYGSRNRELTEGLDNAGFRAWAEQSEELKNFFSRYPNHRLYGEWLVPHSLNTYRDDAWRQFYVFDVTDENGKFFSYEQYQPTLELYGLNYIPPLAIIRNPSMEQLYKQLEKCGQFLVKDDGGMGEGIVLKNYNFVNKFGRVCWAKIITNEFKEQHHKVMGAPLLNGTEMIEQKIVDEFCTEHFIKKEYDKIILEVGEWNNKLIPRILNTVYYELIREESWNFIKKYKNPTLDFKLIQTLTIMKTKKILDF